MGRKNVQTPISKETVQNLIQHSKDIRNLKDLAKASATSYTHLIHCLNDGHCSVAMLESIAEELGVPSDMLSQPEEKPDAPNDKELHYMPYTFDRRKQAVLDLIQCVPNVCGTYGKPDKDDPNKKLPDTENFDIYDELFSVFSLIIQIYDNEAFEGVSGLFTMLLKDLLNEIFYSDTVQKIGEAESGLKVYTNQGNPHEWATMYAFQIAKEAVRTYYSILEYTQKTNPGMEECSQIGKALSSIIAQASLKYMETVWDSQENGRKGE